MVMLGIWLADAAYKKFYLYSTKKPFWNGTELIQVCKKPYDSSEECFKELVTLVDSNTVNIKLPNGAYKTSYDLTCYFAATSLPDQPKYVFCRSWDADGQQWDLMPAWAYLPSTNDLIKASEKFFN